MIEVDRPRPCAATGCAHPVEPRYLFCPRHRAALPSPALVEIRRHCRPGSPGSTRPSAEWIRAAARAVEILAAAEGRPTANRFAAAIPAIPTA